jgi:hypothetical protein
VKTSPRRILAYAALLCSAVATPAMPQAASPRPQTPAISVSGHWQPMIFFVAKGAPDACGPGCSEWIAAQGDIDVDAPQRFRDLLVSLRGRKLPVVFDSPGGYMGKARELGRILREHRMTASVGKTVPEGCRAEGATEASCRRLIRSKGVVRARLQTDDARCYSACVEAFTGASFRQLAAAARMGVHATHLESNGRAEKAPPDESEYSGRRRYLIEMGVDPALVDAAERVRFDQIHILTRQEIADFGIETRGRYETPWMLDKNSQRWTLLKSVTQANGADRPEYRTGVVRISCEGANRILFSYRRELRAGESEMAPDVRLGIGDRDVLLHGSEIGGELAVSLVLTDLESFRTAMAADIRVAEVFAPRGAPGWSSETMFSSAGLAPALGEWLARCTDPKSVRAPNNGGRGR